MVNVRLKGIASAKKKLAGGAVKTYFYAWRGGPALEGEPGTPDFMASYHRALATRKVPDKADTVAALIRDYEASSAFPKSPDSLRAYRNYLKLIDAKFGKMTMAAAKDPRARGEFLKWRDTMQATPRKADYAWTVLAALFGYAVNHGQMAVNPCARGGRLSASDRTEKVWTEDDLRKLFAEAKWELAIVAYAAIWTGQRQGDLLRLTSANIRDGVLRLTQSKSVRKGKKPRKIAMPVPAPLAEALKRNPKGAALFLNSDGKPWTSSGFRASFGKLQEKAGIEGLTFHDFRGTFTSLAAEAGCTTLESCAVSGHAVPGGGSMDASYLRRSLELATNCVRRIEEHTAGKYLQTALQTVALRPAKCDDNDKTPKDKKRSDLNTLGSVVGDVGLEPTTR